MQQAKYLLPNWNDGNIGFVVIILAGIINYLVLLLFFKKKGSHAQVNREESTVDHANIPS